MKFDNSCGDSSVSVRYTFAVLSVTPASLSLRDRRRWATEYGPTRISKACSRSAKSRSFADYPSWTQPLEHRICCMVQDSKWIGAGPHGRVQNHHIVVGKGHTASALGSWSRESSFSIEVFVDAN